MQHSGVRGTVVKVAVKLSSCVNRLREDGAVRVSKALTVFVKLAFTSPAKNCDKFMHYIDRVGFRNFISGRFQNTL